MRGKGYFLSASESERNRPAATLGERFVRVLPIIAVAGLAFEAKIARGLGVRVVYGQNRQKLGEEIASLAAAGVKGILSFGTAGGLDPNLPPGAIVVASGIQAPGRKFETDMVWAKAMLDAIPDARFGELAGVTSPVATVDAKRRLWQETGALAVDMESWVAAEIAEKHDLRFVAMRAVIDPADRPLPLAALAGLQENGRTNVYAVLAALARRPGQLRALARLAGDARKARAALLRGRQALRPIFTLIDTGSIAIEPALEVEPTAVLGSGA